MVRETEKASKIAIGRFKAPMNHFWKWVRNIMLLLFIVSLIGSNLSYTPDWLHEIFKSIRWFFGGSALTSQFTKK